MVILGLTGSIGMGKTTVAAMFRRLGIPVHDADAAVHALTAAGGAAVDAVARAFPGVVVEGAVDRRALGRVVFGDVKALRRLEAILHPLVRARERRFLALQARRRAPLVVLDIPLLYETGGEERCDAVVVVSAPRFVQAARVLGRPGMNPGTLAAILKRQVPDAVKRRRADFVVATGLGRGHSLRAVRRIVRVAKARRGAKWPPGGFRRDRDRRWTAGG